MATKLESVQYKDGHPNGIEEGFIKVGTLIEVEEGGQLKIIGNNSLFHTSTVVKIQDDLVYTRNSIYKVREFPNLEIDNNDN